MEISELIVALKPMLDAAATKKAGDQLENTLGKNLDNVGNNFVQKLSGALGGIDLTAFAGQISGAFAALGLLDIAKFAFNTSIEMAELGTEIARSADKAEIARDKFQLYSQAAKEAGVNSHQFVLAMKMMNKNIYQAMIKPTGDAALSFKAMGVSVHDSNGKIRQTDDVLGDLMDQFKGMEEGPARAALATKIFGIRGHEMIPFLAQGREALVELKQAMEEYNSTVSEESVQNSLEFTKATNRMQLAWMGFKNSLSELGLIRGITWGIQKLTEVISWFSKGLQQMRTYVEEGHAAAFLLETGLGTLAAAALYLGITLAAATIPWLLATAAAVVAATWPFLLLGGAIALVVDDFLAFINGGDSVLGSILKFVNTPSDFPLLELFKSFFALIFDIGSPEKWERIYHAIMTSLFEPLLSTLGPISAAFDKIFGTSLNGSLQDAKKYLGVNNSTGELLTGTGGTNTTYNPYDHSSTAKNMYSASLTPGAANSTSNASTQVSQSNKIDVNVHVSSNASPEDIKHHVRAGVLEAHEELMSHTQQAVEQGHP